jgi:hypothetical protein
MKKGLINMLVFLASTVGNIALWKTEFAEKHTNVMFLTAPVLAFIFALVTQGGKIGRGFKYQDDQGNTVYNGFWGVFVVFFVLITIFNFILKSEI